MVRLMHRLSCSWHLRLYYLETFLPRTKRLFGNLTLLYQGRMRRLQLSFSIQLVERLGISENLRSRTSHQFAEIFEIEFFWLFISRPCLAPVQLWENWHLQLPIWGSCEAVDILVAAVSIFEPTLDRSLQTDRNWSGVTPMGFFAIESSEKPRRPPNSGDSGTTYMKLRLVE